MINKKVLVLLSSVFVLLFMSILAARHLSPVDEVLSHGRVPALANNIPDGFDWETYLQNNQDLGLAGINTEEEAQRHWLEYGKREGRSYRKIPASVPYAPESLPPDFDWETYVSNYGDLERAGVDTKEKAAEHWLTIGAKGGRTYRKIPYQPVTLRPDFDWQTYVNNYEDLRAAGIDTKEEAIEHWLKQGKEEGRTYRKSVLSVTDGQAARTPLQETRSNSGLQQDSKEEAMKSWLNYWARRE